MVCLAKLRFSARISKYFPIFFVRLAEYYYLRCTNRAMPMPAKYLLLLVFALCCFACSEDDPLPPYRRDLAELSTDSRGTACVLTLDDGRRYAIEGDAPSHLTPDSTYRVLATHLVAADNSRTQLASVQAVASPMPIARTIAMPQRIDGIGLLAVWRVPRYINIRATLPSSGEQHAIAFVEDRLTTNPVTGHHTLHLTLLYDKGDNADHYATTAYLSCPIYHYASTLSTGTDTIALTLPLTRGDTTLVYTY